MRNKNISVYIDEKNKKLILRACELRGLNLSSFLKTSGIEKAREILKNEVDDGKQG